jgi:hypothetical protein
MNDKVQFKLALKKYLNTRSFYFVDEFFTYKYNNNNNNNNIK